MNHLEQEHWDHEMGCATEAQNVLIWNRMNMQADDSFKIKEALDKGLFVVVKEGTVYCPSTDAIMGSRKLLDSVHKDRQQALNRIAEMSKDMDEEIGVYILPYSSTSTLENVSCDRDEIPF